MPERVTTRLLLGACALLLAVGWFTVVDLSLKHLRDQSNRAYTQSRTGQLLLTAMLDQETGLRGYQGSGRAEFLAPYRAGSAAFNAAARRAGADAGGDAAIRRSLENQIVLTRRWRGLAAVVIRARQLGRSAPAIAADERLKAIVDAFRTANATLQEQLAARRDSDVEAARRQTVGLVMGMTALAALLAFALMRRTSRAELIYRRSQEEFAEALQASKSEDGAHALLKRHIERRVPVAHAHVLSRNNSADRLEATTAVEGGSELARGLADAQPSSCVAVHTARPHDRAAGASPLLVCDVCGTVPEAVRCQPLVVGGEVIGSVLTVHGKRLRDTDTRKLTESVAQAAPVLGNLRTLAIAEARAGTDALTGLPNRRAIHDALTRMMAQATRAGSPLGLALFDLDHFKRINDTCGHDKGDEVLAAVGQVLASTLRASDFAGRYGGEEFIVLLPDTDAAGATKLCEVLRADVAGLRVAGVGQPITASFGVAAYPDDAPDAEKLLRLADRALYVAKADGRNRVETVAALPAEVA